MAPYPLRVCSTHAGQDDDPLGLLLAVTLLLAGLVVFHGLGLGPHPGSMAGMGGHCVTASASTEHPVLPRASVPPVVTAPELAAGSAAGATAALCVAVLVGLAWLGRRSVTSYLLRPRAVRPPARTRGLTGVADRPPPDLSAWGISRT